MKKKFWLVIALFVVLVLALTILFYPSISKSCKHEKAKDFTVYTENNATVKLSDFKGKPIVVNFWATWCPPCRAELPAFNSVYKKYKGEVVFLMVNVDDEISTVKSFLSQNGYSFPTYYDLRGNASSVYNVSSIPRTVFITAGGIIYGSHTGSMSERLLEGYVKKILS